MRSSRKENWFARCLPGTIWGSCSDFKPRETFQACEANIQSQMYIASDLRASIYLEEVGLGKHWKWTRGNLVLVAQGFVAAGIGWAACLPNTMKPPEAQVPVLCILIKALHPSLSTAGFTLTIEVLWGFVASNKIWGHSIYLMIILVSI